MASELLGMEEQNCHLKYAMRIGLRYSSAVHRYYIHKPAAHMEQNHHQWITTPHLYTSLETRDAIQLDWAAACGQPRATHWSISDGAGGLVTRLPNGWLHLSSALADFSLWCGALCLSVAIFTVSRGEGSHFSWTLGWDRCVAVQVGGRSATGGIVSKGPKRGFHIL